MTNIVYALTALGIILSPVYLWRSGYPQVSHLLMVSAMGLHLLSGRLRWERWWGYGVLFVGYTVVVNLFVYAQYGDPFSLYSSLYYVFNFLVFAHLIILAHRVEVGRFIKRVSVVLWSLLCLEVFLIVSNFGRFFGGHRAMGTFNDPNQLSNWLVVTVVCLMVIGVTVYRSWMYVLIAYVLGSVGVVFSVSRSGGLGVIYLGLVLAMMGSRRLLGHLLHRTRIKLRLQVVVIVSLLVPVLIVASIVSDSLASSGPISSLSSQVTLLFERFQDRSRNTTLEGRGYDRLWKFPEYLVLGAGEGAYGRWAERTWFRGEIHSTPAGVLFSYGVVGTLFLSVFGYHLWKRVKDSRIRMIMLAPIVYSVGTYNLRNWFMWIGFAVVYVASKSSNMERQVSMGVQAVQSASDGVSGVPTILVGERA